MEARYFEIIHDDEGEHIHGAVREDAVERLERILHDEKKAGHIMTWWSERANKPTCSVADLERIIQYRTREQAAANSAALYTVEPGRALHRNGVYQFSLAANVPGVGLEPWRLDQMAHHIAALLNEQGQKSH